MKKFLTVLILLLLAAAVIGYFIYPTISDQLGRRRDAEIMAVYREKTAALGADGKTELFEQAKAWNDSLEQVRTDDVFTAGMIRTSRDYQNRMNVHDGVIGELVIPAIRLSLPIWHLSTETPATRKLVHVNTGSLPADGTGENIILAGPGVLQAEGIPGEMGLTDDRMLEDLDGMVPGNLIILNVTDRTMVYRVSGIQMLSSAGLKEMDLTPGEGEERLTIISPRKDRRLMVQAERIPIREARTLLAEEDQAAFPESWKNVLFLGCPVMIAGLLVLLIIELIRGRIYRLPGEQSTEDMETQEETGKKTEQNPDRIEEVEEQ